MGLGQHFTWSTQYDIEPWYHGNILRANYVRRMIRWKHGTIITPCHIQKNDLSNLNFVRLRKRFMLVNAEQLRKAPFLESSRYIIEITLGSKSAPHTKRSVARLCRDGEAKEHARQERRSQASRSEAASRCHYGAAVTVRACAGTAEARPSIHAQPQRV